MTTPQSPTTPDTTPLYALTSAGLLVPGDLVFYGDAERYVTKVSGAREVAVRVSTIQAHWPYLSEIVPLAADDTVAAARYVLSNHTTADNQPHLKGATGDFRQYSVEDGITAASECARRYENREG